LGCGGEENFNISENNIINVELAISVYAPDRQDFRRRRRPKNIY
jgi:hypothetical protein